MWVRNCYNVTIVKQHKKIGLNNNGLMPSFKMKCSIPFYRNQDLVLDMTGELLQIARRHLLYRAGTNSTNAAGDKSIIHV
jgi:hypothetical protein